MTTESVTTVIIAGRANLAIAVAKLVAGLISGSASMLSEAAHSVRQTRRRYLRPTSDTTLKAVVLETPRL